MAEIVCPECGTGSAAGHECCIECGYPFEKAPAGEPVTEAAAAPQPATPAAAQQQAAVTTTPLDLIMRSLESVSLEVRGVRRELEELRDRNSSRPDQAQEGMQKTLADLSGKVDGLIQSQAALKGALQASPPEKKNKKELLAAFFQTLNAPNSMFEYLFYICVAQIIFVIVTLFLTAYIVTLVRG